MQYYPLLFTSFWIEYQLWALDPLGYHGVNVLLHAANGVLVWRLLARLEVPGAWFAAALFALHPVQVESVAWITERKNLLSGFFFLASTLAYLRFLESEERGGPRAWRAWGIALALFLCALLSKTVACTMPAVVLLLVWWKRGRVTGRDLLHTLPFLVVGIAFALATVWLEKHHVRAAGAAWDLSLAERSVIAGRAVWFYAGKLLWPRDLVFIYPRWTPHAGALQLLLPVLALGVPVALFALRDRIGRGPLVAVLYFGGNLLPALGFFDLYYMRYAFVADHFQYLASIGLIALGTATAIHVLRERAGLSRQSVHACLYALALVLALLSFRQSAIYHDPETLWRDTIARSPGAFMAYNNLGSLYVMAGRTEEAMALFQRSVALEDRNAEAHNNLGSGYHRQGRLDDAIRAFWKALVLDPEFAAAHTNLGQVYYELDRIDEAVAQHERALQIRPNFAEALANLGMAYERQGRRDEAIAAYRRAIAIQPGSTSAYINLGAAFQDAGSDDEAITEYERALARDPRLAEAHLNLGLLYSRQNRLDEAIAAWEAALAIDPTSPAAHAQLCAAHAQRGSDARARPHCEAGGADN